MRSGSAPAALSQDALAALGSVDLTDLAALEDRLRAADPEGRLAPIGLRVLHVGRGVLDGLGDVLARLGVRGRVIVAGDSTPIRSGGRDQKAAVLEQLGERYDVVPVDLGDGLHADEPTIARATEALAGAACVVCVGSGTASDVCKAATAQASPKPVLVLVQSAGSVNGFADDVSVLLRAGVKRTTPTRWADALLVDLDVLAEAPRRMTAAGFGDSIATWTAAADWRLASLLGMEDGWDAVPFALAATPASTLLERADGLPDADPAALDALARSLTASGLAIGLIGTTAALSGGEHLVSHLLDMDAGARGAPVALHGAQVGLATVLMAIVWEEVLARDALPVGVPTADGLRRAIDAAFGPLDPDGVMREECWTDCARKLERWVAAQPQVAAAASDWAAHREALRALTLPAARVARAMSRAGAPMTFEDLEPPVAAATGRWALANCHLMRDRFTAVDLLAFSGGWDEAMVDRVLARASTLAAGD